MCPFSTIYFSLLIANINKDNIAFRVTIPIIALSIKLFLNLPRLIHCLMHSLAYFSGVPIKTKHLYNICTTSAQRHRRWSNIVQCYTNVLCLLGCSFVLLSAAYVKNLHGQEMPRYLAHFGGECTFDSLLALPPDEKVMTARKVVVFRRRKSATQKQHAASFQHRTCWCRKTLSRATTRRTPWRQGSCPPLSSRALSSCWISQSAILMRYELGIDHTIHHFLRTKIIVFDENYDK